MSLLQIRKIVGCACAGNAGNVFSPPTSKERARNESRHVRHARAVMHVGIANLAVAGKTFPAFPAFAQPASLRVWQEAHGISKYVSAHGISMHLRFISLETCMNCMDGQPPTPHLSPWASGIYWHHICELRTLWFVCSIRTWITTVVLISVRSHVNKLKFQTI